MKYEKNEKTTARLELIKSKPQIHLCLLKFINLVNKRTGIQLIFVEKSMYWMRTNLAKYYLGHGGLAKNDLHSAFRFAQRGNLIANKRLPAGRQHDMQNLGISESVFEFAVKSARGRSAVPDDAGDKVPFLGFDKVAHGVGDLHAGRIEADVKVRTNVL